VSKRPATLADAVRILDLDTEHPLSGEWRVLGPDELYELCFKQQPAEQLPAVVPQLVNGVCARCNGSQRVSGRVAGLMRACPDCVARAQQLALGRLR